MKQFSKSLLAVALLAATTGAANASINTSSATAAEAYLSVYDSSQKLTFTLDLGLAMGDLTDNISNADFSRTYDLSSNAMWNSFSSNLNTATTVYGVVVGFGTKVLATGPAVSVPKFSTVATASGAATAIKNHASAINSGAGVDNPGVANIVANQLSSLVADGDTANTGQHNQNNPFSTLFGTKSDAAANLIYGKDYQDLGINNFWLYNSNAGTQAFATQWNLVGSELSLKVAAVPLPAAVWMFGAGLMGVLGLTRRKNAAV
ncbi:MAG: VPLPA-CTERM sorting domain-containing protein [Methylococcaceae bacterium]|nr:VPLPA-CTERM sorting domain-containing protein [Methylococcaceae bacterium]MDP3903974.1 VPLPA-CTERM sorting domain-containing protein [Methylococcaceae bacterium]